MTTVASYVVCVVLTLVSVSHALAKIVLPQEEGTPFSKSLEPTPLVNPFFPGPKHFDASMAAAQMELQVGDLDKAIDLCDDILKRSHRRYASRALTLRGEAYARKGYVTQAWQDFREAIREDGGNAEAGIMMLLILIQLHVI
jgi:tetratricopeptide (TPR) repeat protein